jgi:hypothetical protein
MTELDEKYDEQLWNMNDTKDPPLKSKSSPT